MNCSLALSSSGSMGKMAVSLVLTGAITVSFRRCLSMSSPMNTMEAATVFFIDTHHERTQIHHGFAFQQLGIINKNNRVEAVGRPGNLEQMFLQADQQRQVASGGIDPKPVCNGSKQATAVIAGIMQQHGFVDGRIEQADDVRSQGGLASPGRAAEGKNFSRIAKETGFGHGHGHPCHR